MSAAHKHICDGRIHWINDALRRFHFITEPGALAPRRLLNLQGAFVNGYLARWKAQGVIDRIAAL